MENTKVESFTFKNRIKSMLKVDFRRLLTMPLFYIMLSISILMPILILIMTEMMDGSVSVDPTTGTETIMKGFDYAWQVIAKIPSDTQMGMDIMSMCNIDILYFAIGVLVCIFVSEDFRSGYVKNLFAIRSSKTDYVISKTIIGFVSGTLMILVYFVGTLIGGLVSGVSLKLEGITIINIIMCLLSKIGLVSVFVAIFLVMSLIGKSKLWLSILLSIGTGMLLFMMVSMISPLNSTIINVILCFIGGFIFSTALGICGNIILKKTSLI